MKKKYNLIAFIAVIVIAIAGYIIFTSNKALSYVTISINPDVELAVNNNNVVEEVVPLNEDADVVTSDLELVGMTIEEASEKIVTAAIETGYLDEYSDENVVSVVAVNEDEDTRQDLENKVVARLNSKFEEYKVFPIIVTGVSEEIRADAEQYDISNGKMLLVSRALAANPDLNKEDLVTMSIKEIQTEIKEVVTARHEAFAEAREELQEKWQQEKEELKLTYRNRVQQMGEALLEQNGVDTDSMTEAEKNDAAITALKEKKEKIKETVNKIKDELETTTSNKNYPAIKDTVRTIKERINQGKR